MQDLNPQTTQIESTLIAGTRQITTLYITGRFFALNVHQTFEYNINSSEIPIKILNARNIRISKKKLLCSYSKTLIWDLNLAFPKTVTQKMLNALGNLVALTGINSAHSHQVSQKFKFQPKTIKLTKKLHTTSLSFNKKKKNLLKSRKIILPFNQNKS